MENLGEENYLFSQAEWEINDFLLDPTLDPAEYKKDLVGAVAYDRESRVFYLVERLADVYRSVIHVWEIKLLT